MAYRTADDIVRQKEIDGLKLQYRLRIAISIIYFLVTLLIGTGKAIEIQLVTPWIVVFILMNSILYSLIKKVKANNMLHYSGVVTDALFVISLSVILHHVMDVDKTPFSFILKSDIFPITVVILLFHMINFQPRIVLFSGFLLWSINAGLLIISVITSPYELTSDFSEGFTSYKVNLDFEAGKLILFIVMTMIAYFISRRVRNTISTAAHAEVSSNQLQRYFSPQISQRIIAATMDEARIGGKIQNVAILFSDIKSFTTLSEKLTPDEVLSFLSEYHQSMVSIIFKNNGTLDKFIGDAIMATFGTPVASELDNYNAVCAALEMEEALNELNKKRMAQGKFPIYHRIGIHYGQVLAGNIGTAERLEYTVIGDAVNTASRIEQACKKLETSLLVSEDVYLKAKDDFSFENAGLIRPKGKTEAIRIYKVKHKQSVLQ